MSVQTLLGGNAAAAKPRASAPALSRRFAVLLVVVLVNYTAQIPYSLHLYGLHVSGRGVALLASTLVWFVASYALLARRRQAGYWLLLAFLAVQVVFYFRNEILLIPYGYGLPYHLFHARDALLWVVFLIGDLNFFVAAYFLVYVLIERPRLVRVSSAAGASGD